MRIGAGAVDGKPHQMQEGPTILKRGIMRNPFGKTVKLWSTVYGGSFVKSGRRRCPTFASDHHAMTRVVNAQFLRTPFAAAKIRTSMMLVLFMTSVMTKRWIQRRRRRKRMTGMELHRSKKQATLQSPFLQENVLNRRPSYKHHPIMLRNPLEQAKLMHELAQKRAQGAKEDHAKNVRHANKRYCLICDYAQNLGIPYFGSEQPGNTYYHSPLTLHLFGIVDISRSPNRLDCYCYHEFTGKKGSNNVASLLMNYLFEHGMLQTAGPAERLTIVKGNFSGQNKNNVVLRLAHYLIKMNYFCTVDFVFCVRGHAKNACDRFF
jgi:hypothetical protein